MDFLARGGKYKGQERAHSLASIPLSPGTHPGYHHAQLLRALWGNLKITIHYPVMY